MTVVTIKIHYDQRAWTQMHVFLKALAAGESLPIATRGQCVARNRCSRNGWAYFNRMRGKKGKWEITDQGREYLATLDGVDK